MLIQKIQFQLSVILVLFPSVLEKFPQVVLDQQGASKYTHDFEDGSIQFEVVLDDRNKTICDDCDVNLYAHSILRLAPELLDTEMLFDPFEEELHLPAITVKKCDVLGRKVEVICVVDERAPEIIGIVNDSSEFRRIVVEITFAGETDSLVKEYAVFPIKKFLTRKHLILRLPLFPYNKECVAQMNGEQSCQIKVSSVKHVTSQWFVRDDIHEFGVMYLGVGDSIEDGDFCDDVDLRMDSDAGLCASEVCPKKKRHAEINGGGVNRIEPPMQFEILCDTPFLCKRNHEECKLLKDVRVTEHTCPRERVSACWRFAKSEMVRSFSMCGNDIREFSEATASNQLTEHKNEQMIPMGETPSLCSVRMSHDYSSELPLWQETHNLSEHVLSNMHICTYFDSVANMQISNHGQHIYKLNYCA